MVKITIYISNIQQDEFQQLQIAQVLCFSIDPEAGKSIVVKHERKYFSVHP
jgi:hypothetical protein